MHYAPQPAPRAALAAMITRMDRDIGDLLTLLRSLNLDDNTIVIFTSDNGLTWGEHRLLFSKNAPYEESARVPLIIRYPRLTSAFAGP